jgi:23S rRNA pseudouridine2605 synthase
VASRRAADALIASGAVRVNGRRPPESGTLVEPGVDRVTVDGRRVEPLATQTHVVLHKPAGVVVTASDPEGRPTALQLVAAAGAPRLFPVGRLDAATTGLLLLTDDGELANRLAHPRHKVAKEYVATVAGVPGERDLRALRGGVLLDDGPTQPAEVELLGAVRGLTRVRIVIREGRNRQVRRMLEAVGHPARELARTGFGPLRLGHLRPGDWRRLRPPELAALRAAAGLPETAGTRR